MRRVCGKLAAHDLMVWEAGRGQVLSSYPFSGVPTAHHVTIEGHNTVYAMCAIDALGIPFMLGQRAAIESTCFACQKPVTLAIHAGVIQQANPVTTVVWFSARDGCCVAKARCPWINFFCEEEHLQRWRAEHPHERGTALTLMEAVEVGKTIFGGLLAQSRPAKTLFSGQQRNTPMANGWEKHRKSFIAAAIGTAVVALCCFTPLLVLVLGLIGVSFLTPYLDYVLLPGLAVLLVVTVLSYLKWQKSHRRA